MKRFIKALEDNGAMDRIVKSAFETEKLTGRPVSQEGLNLILDFEMAMDVDLEDIFLQEAHKIAVKSVFKYMQKKVVEKQKIEALNDVDVDALFAKATGKKPSKKQVQKEESKDLNDKIEEMVLESMSKALDGLFSDVLKAIINDCE